MSESFASLNADLLQLCLSHVENGTDAARAGATCKHWHAVATTQRLKALQQENLALKAVVQRQHAALKCLLAHCDRARSTATQLTAALPTLLQSAGASVEMQTLAQELHQRLGLGEAAA